MFKQFFKRDVIRDLDVKVLTFRTFDADLHRRTQIKGGCTCIKRGCTSIKKGCTPIITLFYFFSDKRPRLPGIQV